jgi:hypothetical protein
LERTTDFALQLTGKFLSCGYGTLYWNGDDLTLMQQILGEYDIRKDLKDNIAPAGYRSFFDQFI